MIVILKGADFSANNIGQIDVPFELSEWSKAIVEKFSSYNWTDDAKKALQLFEDTLINNGIKEKINYMALPFLADNINDAMFNVILNSTIRATIGSGSSAKYTVVQGSGIARTSRFESQADIADSCITVAFDQSKINDFHILSYTPEDWPTPVTDYATVNVRLNDYIASNWHLYNVVAMSFNGSYYAVSQKYLWENQSSPLAANTFHTTYSPQAYPGGPGSGGNIFGDVNFSYRGVPLLVSNDGVKTYLSIAEQDYVRRDSKGIYKTGETGTIPSSMIVPLYPLDIDGSWVARHYAVLAHGRSLTNDESKIYQRAIVDFVETLQALNE